MSSIAPTKAQKKRPRALRLQPAQRKALLVEAGVRVFARRGIGASRPTDVAKEAGVAEATIYAYFPTRGALVTSVLNDVARHYEELVQNALANEIGSLNERLMKVTESVADSIDQDPEYGRVWFNWSSATRADIWPRFLEAEARIIDDIAEKIRAFDEREFSNSGDSDIKPEDAARLLLGSAEMIARMKFANRPPAEVRRFTKSAVDVIFRTRAAEPCQA